MAHIITSQPCLAFISCDVNRCVSTLIGISRLAQTKQYRQRCGAGGNARNYRDERDVSSFYFRCFCQTSYPLIVIKPAQPDHTNSFSSARVQSDRAQQRGSSFKFAIGSSGSVLRHGFVFPALVLLGKVKTAAHLPFTVTSFPAHRPLVSPTVLLFYRS